MRRTKKLEYALQLTTKLLSESKTIRAVDLANNLSLPKEFTMSILTQLANAKVIDVIRGPRGGFRANDFTISATIGDIENIVKTPNKTKNREATNYNEALVNEFFNKIEQQTRNVLISDLGRF